MSQTTWSTKEPENKVQQVPGIQCQPPNSRGREREKKEKKKKYPQKGEKKDKKKAQRKKRVLPLHSRWVQCLPKAEGK